MCAFLKPHVVDKHNFFQKIKIYKTLDKVIVCSVAR